MEIYYHVTNTSNIPSIRKHGLLISHIRNVPLSKPHVIYLMKDLVHAGYFASKMAWDTEEPVSILHVKVKPEQLYQDWNTGATVGRWFEYHDDIPPKDIIKVESWGAKTKQRHMKLMKEIFG